MGDIGAIIGIITGLISIFTFLTGASSLQLLKAEARAADGNIQTPPPRPRVYVRSKLLVWVMFAVFVASLAITLHQGLSGGDVEGAVFVLLLMGGVGVIAYVLRFRHRVSPVSFGVIAILGLAGAGFALGSVSRGEEAIDAIAGLVIGIGVTLIAWMFRSGAENAPAIVAASAETPIAEVPDSGGAGEPAAIDSDQETTVLRLAAAHGGEVTVSGVALDTRLSLDDARALLESLHERGYCERTRTEAGGTVYRFPDLA